MKGKIYKISNDINNKIYIGQTVKTLAQRFAGHINESKNGGTRPICLAISKYGEEHFKIEEIEECDVSLLNEREIYWISQYNSYEKGYNATLGGLGCQVYDYDLIYQLLLENKNCKEIQNIVGCNKDTVYTVAKLHNFKITRERDMSNYRKPENNTGWFSQKYSIIKAYDKDNNLVATFTNKDEAAKWCLDNEYSTSPKCWTHIYECLRGKRKTSYGFIWKSE